jgi:acetate kinase
MKILIINSGSSSIKYQFIDIVRKNVLSKGILDIIGIQAGHIKHYDFNNNQWNKLESSLGISHHFDGLKKIHSLLYDKEINAIGHRVVHGGNILMHTLEINEEVKNKIKYVINIAPLHNTANIIVIEISEIIFTGIRNFAYFDTAFHNSIPEQAHRYAIPKENYDKHNVRVYGFHGISQKYVSKIALKYLNKIHNTKLINIHLGNGASMAAIHNGVSIDTSMGFGPNSGLIMGTRSGDLDYTIFFHLIKLGYSLDELIAILNNKSGMLSISCNIDMRDIKFIYILGESKYKKSYYMYYYRIKKYIGSFTSVMNGIDALIFTGGIGYNDYLTRKLVGLNMDNLGIIVDEKKNIYYQPNMVQEIQRPDSIVKILVIPTNEELEISSDIFNLINLK